MNLFEMDAGKRNQWEQKWDSTQEGDFYWFSGDEVPRELADVFARVDLPAGAALDVGCGSGNITAQIADRFRPTVGFDVAFAAIRAARGRAREGLLFVVASSPELPFRDGHFAFVFDRGCLQHVPQASWPTYFRRVESLLRPQGLAQLLIPIRTPPRLTSVKGLRTRAVGLLGRSGSRLAHMDRAIARSIPPSMEVLSLRTYPVQLPSGSTRTFTHALLRKRT